jgi:hypothetical protein
MLGKTSTIQSNLGRTWDETLIIEVGAAAAAAGSTPKVLTFINIDDRLTYKELGRAEVDFLKIMSKEGMVAEKFAVSAVNWPIASPPDRRRRRRELPSGRKSVSTRVRSLPVLELHLSLELPQNAVDAYYLLANLLPPHTYLS